MARGSAHSEPLAPVPGLASHRLRAGAATGGVGDTEGGGATVTVAWPKFYNERARLADAASRVPTAVEGVQFFAGSGGGFGFVEGEALRRRRR